MARPKKKHTDPQESMEDLLVNTVALYSFPYDDRDGERESELPSLREVADQLGTTVLRVRKLLITAEYFSTAVSRQVQQMAAEGNSVEAVMRVAGLKRASVYSYLPYVGLAFNLEQTTVNADRHRLFRKRLKAVEALAEYAGTGAVTKCAEATETSRLQHKGLQDELECLWKAVLAFEGYPFRTAGRGKIPGVKFSYLHSDILIAKGPIYVVSTTDHCIRLAWCITGNFRGAPVVRHLRKPVGLNVI